MTACALIDRRAARRLGAAVMLFGLLIGAGWSGGLRAQSAGSDDAQTPTQLAASRLPIEVHAAHAESSQPVAAAARMPAESTTATQPTFGIDADAVTRGTLLSLALMLGGGCYVVSRRLWDQQLVLRGATAVQRTFWTAPNFYEAVRGLEPRSAFRAIAEDGLEAATHREGRLTDRIGSNEWIVMSLRRSVGAVDAKLRHGLGLLDTISTTAPLVGLLGTVWGIHLALTDAAEPLAIRIGAALTMTAAGLAVAVLAMLSASWLARRNEAASTAVHDFAADVQALLLTAPEDSGRS